MLFRSCTPPFAHLEPTIGALEAGLHVLCEKPMALDSIQAQTMVDAWHKVREAKANLFSVGFQSRYGKNAQQLKRFIDAGELGEVYYVRAAYLRRRGVPAWGVFTSKELNGGGPMIDVGVHVLDLSMWLMGHPKIQSVYGASFRKFGNRPNVFNPWGSWDPAKYDVEDSAFAMIRFENGASGILMATQVAAGEENNLNIRVYGEKGGLSWRQEEPNTLEVKWLDKPKEVIRTGWGYLGDEAKRSTRTPSGHPEGYLEAFANLYRNFARAVSEYKPGKKVDSAKYDFPDVSDGVRGMAFVESVVKSSKSSSKWTKIKI